MESRKDMRDDNAVEILFYHLQRQPLDAVLPQLDQILADNAQ